MVVVAVRWILQMARRQALRPFSMGRIAEQDVGQVGSFESHDRRPAKKVVARNRSWVAHHLALCHAKTCATRF